jgi:hypothetical protein
LQYWRPSASVGTIGFDSQKWTQLMEAMHPREPATPEDPGNYAIWQSQRPASPPLIIIFHRRFAMGNSYMHPGYAGLPDRDKYTILACKIMD